MQNIWDPQIFCLEHIKISKVWGNIEDLSRRNSASNSKKRTFCMCCDCWAICVVNLYKRYAQKLRIIILLHFELTIFRKPLISMISGFWDVSSSPETIHFYFWRDQKPQNSLRRPKQGWGNFIFINIKIMEIEKFENVGKGGRRNS